MLTEKDYDSYIRAHQAYIKELYYSVEYSNSPFFIECMLYCIKEEKEKLRRHITKNQSPKGKSVRFDSGIV